LLNVKVFTTFLTSLDFKVNMVMLLTQDSLVSDQTDYLPPAGVQVVDGDRRPDYRFDNIVVNSLNGDWGQLLKSPPIKSNDTVSVVKDCNSVSKCFYKDVVCTKDKYLNLVVFVYNESTNEVLQAEKLRIR
jgi:hypothetical protein